MIRGSPLGQQVLGVVGEGKGNNLSAGSWRTMTCGIWDQDGDIEETSSVRNSAHRSNFTLFLFSRSKTTWDIILINSNNCSHHQQRPLPPLSEGEELASWIERDRRDLRSLVHHRHLHSGWRISKNTFSNQVLLSAISRVFDFDTNDATSCWVKQRLLLAEVDSSLKIVMVICFSIKSRK